jgi:hypothetical protein
MGHHRAASAARGRPGFRLVQPVAATLVALAVLVIAGAAARSGDRSASTAPSARLLVVTTPAATALGEADALIGGASDAASALGVELLVRRDVAPAAVASVIADAGALDGVAIVDPPVDLKVDPRIPVARLDRGATGRSVTADVEPAALALRSDPARAGGLAVAALGDAGARSIVCLVDETALSVLVERCAGAVRAAPDGTTLEVLHALDPDGDPSGITAAIAARLIDRPDIDAVLLARPGVEAEARLALDGAADGRERLLAVIGPAPDDAAAASSDPPAGADPAADLGVDPRATDQGWLLITGLALVVAGERPGEGPGPRLEVVPAAWP